MNDRHDSQHDDFDSIAPAEVALTRDAPEAAAAPGDDHTWLKRAGLALLVLLLLGGTLFWLPNLLRPDLERIARGEDTPTAESRRETDRPEVGPAAGAESEAEGDPVAPYQQSRFERERRAVEDLISRLLDLQEDLEARAVAQWGAEEMAAARELAADGDDAFLAEEFDSARQRYEQAIASLEALDEQAGAAFEAAIEDGLAALEAGSSADAKAAFELAAAIRSDSDRARRGLQRAAVLDEVMALLAQAEEKIGREELEAARDNLQQALELDDETAAARSRLRDVRQRIVDRDFREALSRGYAALSDGNLDRAREAFRAAERLRPNASEVSEGLQLVEQASTDRRIAALREEAEEHMQAERWSDAVDSYRAALDLDGTLSFARQGRQQAERLQDLSQRMEATLDAPDRLSEDAVLAEARDLLASARAISNPRPGFAAHIDELDELLRVAAEPVPVRLRSDGSTEVTILRVARLGSFEQRQIELRPGRYTATGTRPGFRDVRLDFRVSPDPDANEVVIRTEERI